MMYLLRVGWWIVGFIDVVPDVGSAERHRSKLDVDTAPHPVVGKSSRALALAFLPGSR
jgi:hypothetical protein